MTSSHMETLLLIFMRPRMLPVSIYVRNHMTDLYEYSIQYAAKIYIMEVSNFTSSCIHFAITYYNSVDTEHGPTFKMVVLCIVRTFSLINA